MTKKKYKHKCPGQKPRVSKEVLELVNKIRELKKGVDGPISSAFMVKVILLTQEMVKATANHLTELEKRVEILERNSIKAGETEH